jgi:hypothetical protein
VGECVSTIIPGQTFNVAMEVDSVWTTAVSTAVTGSFMSAVQLNGWNIIGLAAVVQTSVPSTTSPTHASSTTSPSVYLSASTSTSPINPSSTTSQSSTSSSSTAAGAPAATNPSFTTSSPGSPSSLTQGGSSKNSPLVEQNNAAKNIAIGVGVSLSVIGLSCVAFAAWFVVKKRGPAQRVGPNNSWGGMAAGPGFTQLSQVHLRQEMESKENSIARYEMDGRGERLRRGEMP